MGSEYPHESFQHTKDSYKINVLTAVSEEKKVYVSVFFNESVVAEIILTYWRNV
jgi:hypothetical protein